MADKTIHVIGKSGIVDLSEHINATGVVFTDCHITSLNVSGLANLQALNLVNAGKNTLTVLNASGCALALESVDNILATFVANGLSSGTLNLSGGTNAIPDAAGLANKAILVGRGWTVTVNSGSYCAVNVDLSGHTELITLDLSGCTIMQTLNVSGCTNLMTLNITGCTALTSLNATGCTSLTTITGLSGLTTVQTLNLSGCTAFNGDGMGTLNLTNKTALQTLNVSGCTHITTLNVGDDMSSCTLLSSMNISGCTGLQYLWMQHTALTSLAITDLNALKQVKAHGSPLTSFTVVGGTFSNLITLDLSNTSLASVNFSGFGGSFVSFQTLNCSTCASLVTVSGIDAIYPMDKWDFSNCALNQTTVDAILSSAISTGYSGKICYLDGGSNSPPVNLDNYIELRDTRHWDVRIAEA